jgi:hypothetical protein
MWHAVGSSRNLTLVSVMNPTAVLRTFEWSRLHLISGFNTATTSTSRCYTNPDQRVLGRCRNGCRWIVRAWPHLHVILFTRLSRLLVTPIELLKIRQQVAAAQGMAPTNAELARTMFQTHGIRGLYRGVTATALRDAGYGWYFMVVSFVHFFLDSKYLKFGSMRPQFASQAVTLLPQV